MNPQTFAGCNGAYLGNVVPAEILECPAKYASELKSTEAKIADKPRHDRKVLRNLVRDHAQLRPGHLTIGTDGSRPCQRHSFLYLFTGLVVGANESQGLPAWEFAGSLEIPRHHHEKL